MLRAISQEKVCSSERIHFVGNVMIDTLYHNLSRAVPAQKTLASIADIEEGSEDSYGLLTLHRPSNVDDPEVLERLVGVLSQISHEHTSDFPNTPENSAAY